MSTVESVPSSLKQLRACLLCSLVICLFLLLACFLGASFIADCLGDEDDNQDLRHVACYVFAQLIVCYIFSFVCSWFHSRVLHNIPGIKHLSNAGQVKRPV